MAPSLASAAWVTDRVPARLSIDLDGFPTLAGEQEFEVELDPGTWPYQQLAVLDLAESQAFYDFTSVEGTLLGQPFWFDAEIFPETAHFAADGDVLGGVFPLLGVAYLCFSSCEDGEPFLTFPLNPTDSAAPPFLSAGESWTTGTVTSGEREATGHNLAASPNWTDVADPWWSVSLVTPVLLVLPTSASVAGIARLELRSGTPACSDGLDNEGDALIDHPADPACSDANDLEEGLEIDDGGIHEIDASIAVGERLYIGGSDEIPTRVRMRAPAELSRVDVWGGEFRMEGGALRGGLTVRGGRAIVSGGHLTEVGVASDGIAVLRGTNFDRPMGTVADTSGRVTGTLADGTPLDASFWRDSEASQLVLPEPGAVACGVAAASALAARARSRG